MSTAALEPLRKTIEIDCSVEQAFGTFTDGIATWWPLATHSVGADKAESVAFERERVVERYDGGRETTWAEVTVWEPPTRLVMWWHPGRDERDATEVEVRFSPRGDRTRVELVHRYFERRGDTAAEARASYDVGWDFVLSRYREALMPESRTAE